MITTCHCSSSPTATTKAESKPANSGFTETIFAPAKRNTDGSHAHFHSEARVPARQSTSPSSRLICRREKRSSLPKALSKLTILVSLRPKARVIATSGVSCSHAEIIEAARPYNALIAFDADYKTNPAVARQLARLIAAREQDIAAHNLKTTTRIVTWQRYKGIDDAVLANVPLETMTILQWISTLEGKTAPGSPGSLGANGFHAYIQSRQKQVEALAE